VQHATEHGPELSFLRDLPQSREAVEFARERHGAQRRESDGAPFLLHPLEAASMLDRAEFPDPVVAAAVLHDVLEDTDVREAELECRFGSDVRSSCCGSSSRPSTNFPPEPMAVD